MMLTDLTGPLRYSHQGRLGLEEATCEACRDVGLSFDLRFFRPFLAKFWKPRAGWQRSEVEGRKARQPWAWPGLSRSCAGPTPVTAGGEPESGVWGGSAS